MFNCLDVVLAAFFIGFGYNLGKYFLGKWIGLWDEDYNKHGRTNIVDVIMSVIILIFFMWLMYQFTLF